ncbi:MAG: type IV conjugative transfer system protein TraE [Alphaproteobacteria bacterium]|uniref:Type IV conjugative transfer system protein TraE n=1 Tax=Candidatus Nitrobium versatile TaxID=2884831 RepID=A0A953SF77_9BACT|nr:type IV conjugative transfer system protein TraE [Candidatus Nitrobium versatile]
MAKKESAAMKDKNTPWVLLAQYAREGAVWKVAFILSAFTIVLMGFALSHSSQTPKKAYIVPGIFRPGIYTAGEEVEDVVGDVAERFVLLIGSVTPDTADLVERRSARYLSPYFQSRFSEELKLMLDPIRGGIGFLFSPTDKRVRKVDEKTYSATISGTREMISGGVVKKTEKYSFEITLERTAPTELNVYGYQITDMRKGAVNQ